MRIPRWSSAVARVRADVSGRWARLSPQRRVDLTSIGMLLVLLAGLLLYQRPPLLGGGMPEPAPVASGPGQPAAPPAATMSGPPAADAAARRSTVERLLQGAGYRPPRPEPEAGRSMGPPGDPDRSIGTEPGYVEGWLQDAGPAVAEPLPADPADWAAQPPAGATPAAGETSPAGAEVSLPMPVPGPIGSVHPPVAGDVIQDYGWVRFAAFDEYRLHPGVDLAAAAGTAVAAVADGTVLTVDDDLMYGRTVTLTHAGGWQSRYAGMGPVRVAVGERVPAGTVLGIVGPSGPAEAGLGPHLHFEIRLGPAGAESTNPAAYLP